MGVKFFRKLGSYYAQDEKSGGTSTCTAYSPWLERARKSDEKMILRNDKITKKQKKESKTIKNTKNKNKQIRKTTHIKTS